jgi:hypothetical protein
MRSELAADELLWSGPRQQSGNHQAGAVRRLILPTTAIQSHSEHEQRGKAHLATHANTRPLPVPAAPLFRHMLVEEERDLLEHFLGLGRGVVEQVGA